ncbi:putative rta1 domain protein [Lasiodiplodia theobromae]|uniref:Rta1 domain protein n=1 Tax=Lasiodiplodia theobromae TaxID=45133 RepID=A0A8H7MAF1_9PEZI|nr:putative rta1 domain protein [Lasiodiplodia theobromae]
MDNVSLRTGCPAYIPGIETSYGYVPSEGAGIAFVVIFGVSSLLHLGQTIWSRQWWTILFAIGGLTEVIGWAGRLWSAYCPYNTNAFLMQITTLILAPTFWTAALYVILGRLITLSGPSTSPLSPRTYLIAFCTADVVSLILQAVGGGMASVAASDTPAGDTAPGTNIMVAGIVFQMAAITVFCALFAVFLKRTVTATKKGGEVTPLSARVKVLVVATTASIAFIYVRSIYRTIELLEGWDGYLITHEVYFVVLDGAMMVCAVAVFNLVHPGWFLVGGDGQNGVQGGRGGKKMSEVEMESRPFSTASTVEAGGGEEKEGTKTPRTDV